MPVLRQLHLGVRVGGFHRAPALDVVQALCVRLRDALPQAGALLAWTGSLPIPGHTQQFTSVAMRHGHEYPMNEGRIVSDQGLDIAIGEYEKHFAEHQVPHSTALHSLLHGQWWARLRASI
jgi:sulfhydrogenase subunit alpha